MDKPDLIVACVVGDGEAESGPTATAWHGFKYIDAKESGAVLPIVHINGFKISERTIYGCMDDKELVTLFTGYGYQCRFVEDLDQIDNDLAVSLDWALTEISNIQSAARSGKPIEKPRWPVILLRTPKGWTGPKKLDGNFIEGSFHSHQVPLPLAGKDEEQLKDLQDWLVSYKPADLFAADGAPVHDILDLLPADHRKLGQLKETYDPTVQVDIPDWRKFAVHKGEQVSPMKRLGEFLDDVMLANPTSFRVFSPDELVSNKLDSVFNHTGRNFQWDQYSNNQGGRVIEIQSEHCCQGFMQGYTSTGRVGLFPSYESFLGIIQTMMAQFMKFSKMAQDVSWRGHLGSLNYLETSTWTRQEHNGFSHQNPSFIGAVLNLKAKAARVYYPADANTVLSTMAHCLRSRDYVNLVIGTKAPSPVYLSADEADAHCCAGLSIWKFASTEDGLDPDVVLVGIGTELTFEVVKAAELLRKLTPTARVRIVNINDLMVLGTEGSHPHSLTDEDFDHLFTNDKPVHFNYHGYAAELKALIFGRPQVERITVESYREEGTTTTPFDMMLLNHVSRFHVAEYALKGAAKRNKKLELDLQSHLANIQHQLGQTRDYIYEHGTDPEDTYDMPKF